MNWRRYIPLLIVIVGVVVYHNSFYGKFVFDDHTAIRENYRIRNIWPPWQALGGTARPVVNLSLAANYAWGGEDTFGYHSFNLTMHILAGLTLYGVLRRTLIRVGRPPEDNRLEIARARSHSSRSDEPPAELPHGLPSGTAYRLDNGGTRRVASSADSTLPGHARQTPRPRGTVALQDQVDSRQSLVISPAHAAVLAGIIALIWVVHPLNAQAVTYIIQRGESMMGLFYLLTLYCFIQGVESSEVLISDTNGSSRLVCSLWSEAESARRRSMFLAAICSHRLRRILWFALAIAACAIGMGCKEVMVTAPLMVLFYDRIFVSQSFQKAIYTKPVLYVSLFATLIIPAILVTQNLAEDTSAGFGLKTVTWWQYGMTQPSVIVHYVLLAFYPMELCFDYMWPVSRGFWQIVPPSLVVMGMLVLTVLLLFRQKELVNHRAMSFIGIWFFGVLSVTSSIMPIADFAVEHRMYLPLIALIALGVLIGYHLLSWLAFQSKRLLRIATFGCITVILLIICMLGWLTHRRNEIYYDEALLWAKVQHDRPGNYRAHSVLAKVYMERGEINEAIAHCTIAITLRPTYKYPYLTMAKSQMVIGNYMKAEDWLRYVLGLDSEYADAHNLMAYVCIQGQRYREAIGHSEYAIRINSTVHGYHHNLGLALMRLKQYRDAEVAFKNAIRYQPSDIESLHALGYVLASQDQYQDAVAAWRQALSINPSFVPSIYELAWVLATCADSHVRNGRESLQLAKSIAARQSQPNAATLEVLAAAFAEVGQYEQALRMAEQAQRLPVVTGVTLIPTRGNAERMMLYREGKPYRMEITDATE